MMTKFYVAVGVVLLMGYLAVASWGVIFSGTDGSPSYSMRTGRSGGRSGGFFWGGGYRGGK